MKKLFLIFSFVCTAAIATAQEAPAPDISEKKQQDIEALKAAFITKELELTPDEAKQFWPVYNQYEKEMNTALRDNTNPDVIEKEQKVVNIRKKYKDQFTKVLGNPNRMNRLYNAEGKFRKILLRTLQQRQMKRAGRRPGIRNN